MAYEQKREQSNGDVLIFKNMKANDGNRLPEYTGSLVWKNEKISIALWVREGKNGKFFSGKASEPFTPSSGNNQSSGKPTNDLPF